MNVRANVKFQFQYDYINFFITLVWMMTACLLVDFFMFYIYNIPYDFIVKDIWVMVERCGICAALLNFIHNIERIYKIIGYNVISPKKENNRELVKAYPKYSTRRIPLNKEITN